jgi:hypothetical protein
VASTGDFIRDEQVVHLGGCGPLTRQERWGRVPFWQLHALARGRRSFWALALLVGIQSASRLRRSAVRDGDGWVKVTGRLLPGVDRPSPKAKRTALAELAATGIVEVRRRGHQAPEVRLLPPKPGGESL